MKKKKSFRDIRNAVVMLCVMLAMLSTATFAWFSMNDRVSATNMAITAKSDSSFLLIGAGQMSAAEVQAGNKSTVEALNTDAQLLPVAHDEITNVAAADTVSNWYYMRADAPTASASTGSKTPLTSLENYVLVNEFSITSAVGSATMNNLKCTATVETADEAADAVKVLVATATAVDEFEVGTRAGSVSLAPTITSGEVVSVKVYVYWDGNDSDVFTNNMAKLQETTVSLDFTATVAN